MQVTDFGQWVEIDPDRTAIICGDQSRSWSEFWADAVGVANALSAEDKVLVQTGTNVDSPALLLGALLSGALVIPMHPRTPPAAVQAAASALSARIVADGDGLMDDVHAGKHPTDSLPSNLRRIGDLDWDGFGGIMWHTSGTTGAPKPVLWGAKHLSKNMTDPSRLYAQCRDDVTLVAAPITHLGGFASAFAALYSGSTLVLLPAWNPLDFADSVSRHRVTNVLLVPTHLMSLAAAKIEPLPSLRHVLLSAAPFSLTHHEIARSIAPNARVEEAYAATEFGLACYSWESTARPGESVGRPSLGARIEIRIDGEVQPVGITGEVWVKPSYSSEWITAGDAGYLSEDGQLSLAGRIDDAVLTGGHTVHPREVELVLEQHPGVRTAAVIGRDDEYYGQILVAFICGDVDGVEIQKFAAERLPSYKVPRAVEVIEEIPTSPVGKMLKRELR
jgi:long-chain acyl-CoA synthetase